MMFCYESINNSELMMGMGMVVMVTFLYVFTNLSTFQEISIFNEARRSCLVDKLANFLQS
jgi:uncharacterized membrane protein YjfL (UPF0719 family)